MVKYNEGIERVPAIQMTSVMADSKQPFLKITTRWNYITRFIDAWKTYIKARTYMAILAVIGVLTLNSIPIVGVLSLAGACYYWQIKKLQEHRLNSKRSVMIGH